MLDRLDFLLPRIALIVYLLFGSIQTTALATISDNPLADANTPSWIKSLYLCGPAQSDTGRTTTDHCKVCHSATAAAFTLPQAQAAVFADVASLVLSFVAPYKPALANGFAFIYSSRAPPAFSV